MRSPYSTLRKQALSIAEAGLEAADGGRATLDLVRRSEDGLEIGGLFHPLPGSSRLTVLGGGKATLPVALALEQILGDRIDDGVIVLRRGEPARTELIEVLHADHPLPSPDSMLAARRVAEIADQASEGDLVITCFTGGRSALLSFPPPGVSLEEKLELNELLLASGMPISEINTVRKHVSSIKGGRLAERIAPARIVNLTVSDVAGNAPDVLADLTTQDTSTPEDAVAVLRGRGLLERVPRSIRAHLESPAAHSPDLSGLKIDSVMLADGGAVCEAMATAARAVGLKPEIVSTSLEGNAVDIGRRIGTMARQSAPGTVLLGCGGEATVELGEGKFGDGGPNQEAALAAGLAIEGTAAAIVFLDTDGSDGGTDAAGAICDGETALRARELDLDLGAAVALHSSKKPLEALQDLIHTGPTGTNVNDLFVAVIGAASEERK